MENTMKETVSADVVDNNVSSVEDMTDEVVNSNAEEKITETTTDDEVDKSAEPTVGTAENSDVVEKTTEQISTTENVDVNTTHSTTSEVDNDLAKRLEAQNKEIENLKKEMAKLRKANDFTSTGNSNSQNNRGGKNYSDGDILNFRWKI